MLNALFHKAFIRSNPCNSNWLRQASDRDYHLLSGLFPKLLSCCCQCLGASAGTAFASAQLLKKRKKKERKKGEVYSAWQGPPYIFKVTPRGLYVVALRKKLCHCSVRECVSGCTAALLNTRARGLHSTGSVQRDGGMQETERGRLDGSICVKVHGENKSVLQKTNTCDSAHLCLFSTFCPLFTFIPSRINIFSPSSSHSCGLYNHNLICLGSRYNEHNTGEKREIQRGATICFAFQ